MLLRWTFNYDDDTVEMSEGTLILLFFVISSDRESGLLELYFQYNIFFLKYHCRNGFMMKIIKRD